MPCSAWLWCGNLQDAFIELRFCWISNTRTNEWLQCVKWSHFIAIMAGSKSCVSHFSRACWHRAIDVLSRAIRVCPCRTATYKRHLSPSYYGFALADAFQRRGAWIAHGWKCTCQYVRALNVFTTIHVRCAQVPSRRKHRDMRHFESGERLKDSASAIIAYKRIVSRLKTSSLVHSSRLTSALVLRMRFLQKGSNRVTTSSCRWQPVVRRVLIRLGMRVVGDAAESDAGCR